MYSDGIVRVQVFRFQIMIMESYRWLLKMRSMLLVHFVFVSPHFMAASHFIFVSIHFTGLQKVPKFIGKVIQMFDIFKIRFGATIVGPAGVYVSCSHVRVCDSM